LEETLVAIEEEEREAEGLGHLERHGTADGAPVRVMVPPCQFVENPDFSTHHATGSTRRVDPEIPPRVAYDLRRRFF
jgi:hypothetical protein